MACNTNRRVCIKPAEIDVCFVRATTNTIEVVLTNVEGDSVDISLDTVKFTARDSPGGDIKIAESNAPGEHLDPAEGRTEFTIDKTDLDGDVSQTADTYWFFEVRRITPGGGENVYIQGRIIITPDVGAAP